MKWYRKNKITFFKLDKIVRRIMKLQARIQSGLYIKIKTEIKIKIKIKMRIEKL